MGYFLFKVLLSALIIAGVSELAQRISWLGALLASLPLTSILAMIWLYRDTGDKMQIAQLSYDIFYLVIPSLLLFLALPFLLKRGLSFYWALFSSALICSLAYLLTLWLMQRYA